MNYRIPLMFVFILMSLFVSDSVIMATSAEDSNWPVVYNRGPSTGKYVALTFDDAPSPDTDILLKILESHDVKATFFLEGIYVQLRPDKLISIVRDGHEIGNHSWNHPNFTRISDDRIYDEIENTNKIITDLTGIIPTLFRPPGGSHNRHVDELVYRLNMSTVMWTVDTADYQRPSKSVLINRVMNRIGSGGIVLMHDGVDVTREALPDIITGFKNRGYTIVTVGEMLEMTHGMCPWVTFDSCWEMDEFDRGIF